MQAAPEIEYDISWQFIPGSSQQRALAASTNIVLLTGGRGWGKTECQLMRFRRHVGSGYGSHWRGVIFDREYKNLDDLIVKSRRLFGDLDGDDAEFLSSNSALKWKWKTGEELLFRVAKNESDYWSYHGHEYPFIGWNELTKYPNIKLWHKMLSVNRSGFDPEEHTPKLSNGGPAWTAEELAQNGVKPVYDTPDGKPLPPIPLEICATTNPYGAGHNWVKREFIDPAPYGHIVRRTFNIFNPKTKQDEVIERTQTTVFGSFRENPYLSPQYIAGLHEETDENIIKAWVHGDWDIVAGGAFDDVWRKHIHVLPRFKIPPSWALDRSFDWGSSHPFSVGWWAEADGTEAILPDGSIFCPPRGTLIQFAEIYGSTKPGANTGVKWPASKIAEAIKLREIEMMQQGWITVQPSPGPADNQISNVTESDTATIETKMASKGIAWTKSDKAPGTRKIGLELIRERLDAAKYQEDPAIYFMENCVASITTIPVLPRDEDDMEDVDTDTEDHPYDMVRYRVLKASSRMAKNIRVSF